MGNKDSDKTKQYKIKAEKQTKNKKEGKKKGNFNLLYFDGLSRINRSRYCSRDFP